MLVLYLFGSCPKIHGTPALVHNEGVLCISCTVTGSYTIKWVALSIILTSSKVCCNMQQHVRKMHLASSGLVGSGVMLGVMLSLDAKNNVNQWFLLHVACRGRAGTWG